MDGHDFFLTEGLVVGGNVREFGPYFIQRFLLGGVFFNYKGLSFNQDILS